MTMSLGEKSGFWLERLGQSARTAAWRTPLYQWSLGGAAPVELDLVPGDLWPGDGEKGLALLQGQFAFAGQRLQGEVPVWRPNGASNAWMAALHGFDWLRHLRAVGSDPARRFARAAIAGWLGTEDRFDRLTWRPDILAQRICAWLGFHDFYCASADDLFRSRVFASLVRQTKHLHRVSQQVDAPDRLIAAKALIHASLALRPLEERLDFGLKALSRSLDADFLPDGHHRSRSPSTLLEALAHLVDIRHALRLAQLPLPAGLTQTIDRAAPAVRFLRHNDQSLACFHGGREETPLAVDAVLTKSEARGRPTRSLPHSGFERLTCGRSLLLMDTGAPEAGAWGRSAHAGLLSFEFSHGKDRIIVNCGRCPAHGPLTGALRGSAAHSTLTVDGRDPCSQDANGRLRACPDPFQAERRAAPEGQCVSAAHEGYLAALGLTHRRRLFLSREGQDLRGEDALLGPGGHEVVLRFHLHPKAAAALVQDGREVLIRPSPGQGWRMRVSGGALSLEDSLYVPDGLTVRRSQQVVIRALTQDTGTTFLKWALSREGDG